MLDMDPRTIIVTLTAIVVLTGCSVAPKPVTVDTPNGTLFVDDGGRGAIPILFGHSYAGAVVAQYAAEHPEHVAGVVYIDAAAVPLPLTAQQLEQLTAGALTSLTSWDPQARINAYAGPRFAIVAADVANPLAFDTQFPDVRSVRISGAGHWLMLDKPDEVTAAIEAFVEGIAE
jgi:pimeloyl-ACP methyl ester carboxylesterase